MGRALTSLTSVQVHIEFTDGEERISLEGPTEEVEQAQAQIQDIIKDLVSSGPCWEIIQPRTVQEPRSRGC